MVECPVQPEVAPVQPEVAMSRSLANGGKACGFRVRTRNRRGFPPSDSDVEIAEPSRNCGRAWMPKPEGTYVGWIDFRGAGIAERPAEYFGAAASVALTEGTMCGRAGDGFARLIFATPQPVLDEIVRRLGKSLPASATA